MGAGPGTEEALCNLCGRGDAPVIMRKRGYEIRKCGCGLVYVSPRLAAERLAEEVYGEGYFEAEGGYGIEDYLGGRNAARSLKVARKRLDALEKRARRGRLLDVGCAGGYFLSAAKERGWDARGVEISEFAAAHAREKMGLDVRAGDFCLMEPEPDSYDLITMLDAIEHLQDPARALGNVYESLKRGGYFFAVTPNFEGLPSRVLGENWGLIEPEHHFYYFTQATLGAMLTKAGFEVVEWSYPLLGLGDLLLSAGTLQRAGAPVKESHKSFVRKYLRAPRDAARAAVSALDEAVFAPLFAKGRGVNVEVLARRPE